jgi:N-acyl-D-aspartate/D-glutamate deacylase
MSPNIAGGTALASALPPWVADGGLEKLLERLHDPAIRSKIRGEMAAEHADWENLYRDCGGAAGVMISSLADPKLKDLAGKTVAEVAAQQKKDPLDALFDLVIADKGQTGALYFMASEQDNQYAWK